MLATAVHHPRGLSKPQRFVLADGTETSSPVTFPKSMEMIGVNEKMKNSSAAPPTITSDNANDSPVRAGGGAPGAAYCGALGFTSVLLSPRGRTVQLDDSQNAIDHSQISRSSRPGSRRSPARSLDGTMAAQTGGVKRRAAKLRSVCAGCHVVIGR